MNSLVTQGKKELTELENSFLNALFDPKKAAGDPKVAFELAGYKDTSNTYHVLDRLKNEIIDRATHVLAAHTPKAVLGLIKGLTEEESTKPGIKIRVEVAKQILDRVGIVKKEKIEIDNRISGGIFILPAKEEPKTIEAEYEVVNG